MTLCLGFACVRLRRKFGPLWLGVLLLASGCATAPGPHGARGTYRQRAAVAEEEPEEGPAPGLEPSADSMPQPRVRPLRYRHPQFMRATRLGLGLEAQREEAKREEPSASGRPEVPEGRER
jgi:hypothetical protein